MYYLNEFLKTVVVCVLLSKFSGVIKMRICQKSKCENIM